MTAAFSLNGQEDNVALPEDLEKLRQLFNQLGGNAVGISSGDQLAKLQQLNQIINPSAPKASSNLPLLALLGGGLGALLGSRAGGAGALVMGAMGAAVPYAVQNKVNQNRAKAQFDYLKMLNEQSVQQANAAREGQKFIQDESRTIKGNDLVHQGFLENNPDLIGEGQAALGKEISSKIMESNVDKRNAETAQQNYSMQLKQLQGQGYSEPEARTFLDKFYGTETSKNTIDYTRNQADISNLNSMIKDREETHKLALRKYKEGIRQFGLKHALDQYKAQTGRIIANKYGGSKAGETTISNDIDELKDLFGEVQVSSTEAKALDRLFRQGDTKSLNKLLLKFSGRSDFYKPGETKTYKIWGEKAKPRNIPSVFGKYYSN